MGASEFFTKEFASSPKEAYREACRKARDYYGSRPYTGSIKETGGFTVLPESEYAGKDREKYANDLMADGDKRINDKWGPCGCVPLKGTKAAKQYRERNGLEGKQGTVYLFFGWASC